MPDWFVTAVRTTPVSRSVAVTVAADTAAPVWSVTRPDKLADTCAPAGREQRHESKRTATQSRRRPDIILPLNGKTGFEHSGPHAIVPGKRRAYDLIE